MKTGHHLLLLHKQMHDKRGIAESLHMYTNRARLNACMKWMYFQVKYHNSQSIRTPLYEESLKFITHRCTFKRLQRYFKAY